MNVISPTVAECDGEVGRQPELSLERSRSGADVSDRVPRLFDDESPTSIIAHEDVDRMGRVGPPDWKLEPAISADRRRMSQQELLDREVAGVVRIDRPVAGEGEPRLEPEALAEAEPRTQGSTGPKPELDSADLALAQADEAPELGLGQPASATRGTNVATEPNDSFVCEPIDFDGEF